MASAEEIKAQINSLQSQKDAIDEKIKLIKDMLEGLEKQYDIYTKRAEDVEELFEIYKSISEDNDAVSSGYYYSYFIEKLTDERRNYLDILFDFSDYAGDCNRQVLFHKFRQLIFHNPRHLFFHSLRHLFFHTYFCYLGLPEMAAHYY